MSDAATTEMPPQIATELEKIEATTKKGFDLQARLKNRGLRKASITLYLDEEKGPQLGWANDTKDALGNVVGRDREGIVGKLDALMEDQQTILDQRKVSNALAPDDQQVDLTAPTGLEGKIAELEKQRDELTAELTKTALVVNMRAVPPIIQKDCRRKAKATLGVTDKSIPDDLQEEFTIAHTAHLMSVMFQSITDNESGETNSETSYADAIALIGYLPKGQFDRLDLMMGQVQYTDAISLSIEGQEDFS